MSEKEKEFKVGDVVRLKSGGPDMVIDDDSRRKFIHCTWFCSNGSNTKGFDFRRECLEHIKKSKLRAGIVG